MEVQTGAAEVVLAGGAESMSQAEFYATALRWGAQGRRVALEDRLARSRVTAGRGNHPVPGGMIETAENLRRGYGIAAPSRTSSRCAPTRLAVAAHEDGLFAEEIVPVAVPAGGARGRSDEHPARGRVASRGSRRLRPVMAASDPEATVTAGNASGQNDGAAVCVVTHPDRAAELGLRPIARLRLLGGGRRCAGDDGDRPRAGHRAGAARAGLSLDELDLIELNEAFAAQVLAVLREWELRDGFERVNVHGSGISLGHPVGRDGRAGSSHAAARAAPRGARYGLETMCIGGGQGLAAVFERSA